MADKPMTAEAYKAAVERLQELEMRQEVGAPDSEDMIELRRHIDEAPFQGCPNCAFKHEPDCDCELCHGDGFIPDPA